MMRFLRALVPAVIALLVMTIALPRSAMFAAEVVRDESGRRSPDRFAAVDLFIDSGETQLAAWQVELSVIRGIIRIVGIENGEHPAFNETPPYYDPDAMMNDRVILAQYSLARPDRLPSGRVRIATVHIQVEGGGEPEFELAINAAGNSRGRRIEATAHFEMRIEP